MKTMTTNMMPGGGTAGAGQLIQGGMKQVMSKAGGVGGGGGGVGTSISHVKSMGGQVMQGGIINTAKLGAGTPGGFSGQVTRIF